MHFAAAHASFGTPCSQNINAGTKCGYYSEWFWQCRPLGIPVTKPIGTWDSRCAGAKVCCCTQLTHAGTTSDNTGDMHIVHGPAKSACIPC
jgi:hypothetical protein